ncbi:MAG: hypothetical protein RR877_10435 [Aurantimicrobium sp.]|uniref:hypothetical protein n=1 Tax=Aurantimicrobium sp. TaxID=1930784 RepID=UPI002FCA8D9F
MSNSRFKKIGEYDVEAVAKSITFQYDTVNPGNTLITFAYRDYLLDAEKVPVTEAGDSWDLITLKLGDILDWDLGEGIPSVVAAVEAIKSATNLAHNKRANGGV